jgi:quercetin dioxygenase-like cupin family protein
MNQPIATLEPTAPRLREAPAARFSGPQHAFDLLQLSAHLLNEAHVGANGHRQMTIFRHDATTMVLFAFEAGGALANHHVNGLVTIHALDGALTVEVQSEAGWQTHNLRAQGILVLSPGVLHNVMAHEASRMLLTVHLERGAAASQ